MTELIQDAEELFPPRPGGMVDSHRKKKAQEQYQIDDMETEDDGNVGFDGAIPVDAVTADTFSAQTFAVSTSFQHAHRVLPADKNRKRAIIMTLDQPVIIANSANQANDNRNAGNTAGMTAGGFVLPVNTPVPIDSTAEVWVAATSATLTRVSIISETRA